MGKRDNLLVELIFVAIIVSIVVTGCAGAGDVEISGVGTNISKSISDENVGKVAVSGVGHNVVVTNTDDACVNNVVVSGAENIITIPNCTTSVYNSGVDNVIIYQNEPHHHG